MPPPAPRQLASFPLYPVLGIAFGFFAAMLCEFWLRPQENSLWRGAAPVPMDDAHLNRVPFGPATLLEAVNHTIMLNPVMNGTVADYDCTQIFGVLEKGITFDSIRENIELAVNRGMVIVCDPKEMPKRYYSNKRYHSDTNSIHMVPNTIDMNVEIFAHALSNFLSDLRHSTPTCLMLEQVVTFPIYLNLTPISVVGEVTNYQVANDSHVLLNEMDRSLDEGDKRIENFRELWRVSKGGRKAKSLSPEDEIIFNQYRNASESCVSTDVIFHEVIMKNTYDIFKAKMRKNEKIMFVDMNAEYVFAKGVVRLEDKDGKYYVYYKILDPAVNVFDIVKGVKDMLNKKYSAAFHLERTMERLDIAFRMLSLAAREIFYPETMILVREEEKKCPLPEPGYRNTLVVS